MLEPNRRRNLKREILLMTKIAHPILVKMYEAYESKKQVFIVEEYLSGQSLQFHLKNIKDSIKDDCVSRRVSQSGLGIINQSMLNGSDSQANL